MTYRQHEFANVNPMLTLGKLALGLLIEQRAPQFAPLYHTGNMFTANNSIDFTISALSLMSSSAMRSTFRY